MRIATDLAGFTLAEADILRKAMGKKDKETMKAQKQKFVQGAKKKGIASAKADKIFEQIKEFAEYGFNKSHSAAYAFLAYQTAYLKAHYPVHFLAALLTSEAERGATPQVVKYIGECHEMGIQVLPPDINKSEFRFTVEGGEHPLRPGRGQGHRRRRPSRSSSRPARGPAASSRRSTSSSSTTPRSSTARPSRA